MPRPSLSGECQRDSGPYHLACALRITIAYEAAVFASLEFGGLKGARTVVRASRI